MEPSIGELYEIYMKQSEREDRIQNNRLSWFLTSQGLLFAALAIAAQNTSDSDLVIHLRWSIPLVGLCASMSCYGASFYGHKAQIRLGTEWSRIVTNRGEDAVKLPSPFGAQHQWLWLFDPSLVIPAILSLAWSRILLLQCC